MTAALNFDLRAANDAMGKAKIALMAHPDCTFFVHCLLSLEHKWEPAIPTACTDGRTVWYSPAFFMACSPEERVGLMLHETLHVVFMHMLRLLGMDPEKWNWACDFVINLIIIARGFKLPGKPVGLNGTGEGYLYDRQFEGMNAEQVYALIPDQPTCQGWSDLKPAPKEDGMDQKTADKKLQQQLDDMLVMAVQAAEKAGDKPGSIPGEIELYVKSLLNPQVPWHRILAKYFSRIVKTGRSFRRPNRRYLDSEIIMPVKFSLGISHGAAATDISGSVTDKLYQHYVSETAAVLRNVKPEYIDFMKFDTTIKGTVDRLTRVEDLMNVQFHGRGGTRIEPVLQWAKEHNPDWFIIFTDGHFNDLHTRPKCPVIWIIHDNPRFTAPFGKVIHIQQPK